MKLNPKFLAQVTKGEHYVISTKKLQGRTKAGFILRSMFPNLEYIKRSVKYVSKCPALYPIGITAGSV